MRVGIKVGPYEWQEKLTSLAFIPECVEVWYRIDWHRKYDRLFAFLREKGIPFGLHFWGSLEKKVQPNFAYPETKISQASIELAKRTIEQAKKHQATYVNIHPGASQLSTIDLDKKEFRTLKNKCSPSESYQALYKNCSILRDFARQKNILLLIETVPSFEPRHWRNQQGRLTPHKSYNTGLNQLLRLGQAGFSLTNDFGHSLADIVNNDPEKLYQRLYAKTKQLVPFTKLIHLNTVVPPFNGTDSHNGITQKDFEAEAIPTKNQLLKLLRLFKNHSDLWIIPEPKEEFIKNSRILQNWLKNL